MTTSEPGTSASQEMQAIDSQASVLMKRGISLLCEPDPQGLDEALACFDQALELRRQLPTGRIPAFGYGLAACWLNRADLLVRRGGGDDSVEAIRAYDASIALLQELPMDRDPRYRRRLAIAHQNRGLALQAAGGAAIEEAIAAFARALSALDHEGASAIDDRQLLQATVYMNLANVQIAQPGMESESGAFEAAQRSLGLIASLEAGDPGAAEVGLKARHILCRAIAGRLSRAEAGDVGIMADVHRATDAVEGGLGLIRLWEEKGVVRFGEVGADLFRFGARVYQQYQPHFLDEFLRDFARGQMGVR